MKITKSKDFKSPNISVFLGGTTSSNWRQSLIKILNENVNYFDPVVDNWDDVAYNRELIARKNCDFVLYVLSPCAIGQYSTAELIDDSNKRPEKTLCCLLIDDFDTNGDPHEWSAFELKSMKNVFRLAKKNGANVFHHFGDIAIFLNHNK